MSAEQTTIAVGYVRVATGSARKREGAVYLQRQAILRYAKINGIGIPRFYSDHACISDIAMRQGLSDAMEYIAKGKASALIVADLTRLTRSIDDFLRFVELHAVLKGGPSLISVQEQVDTCTVAGRVRLDILHTLANWESNDLERGA